jgi:hypothetical protein
MTYLTFNTLEKANIANEKIWSNINGDYEEHNEKTGEKIIPPLATTYAQPLLMLDNCYCFLKPDTKYMTDVIYDGESEYNVNWFPPQEIGI